MGIPSYYKRLLDSVAGLIQKTHPGTVHWLWMDFNCLIYHCLRRPGTPVYPGHEGRIQWEKEFIESIVEYCQHIVKQVKPTHGVYIAIDGVVPMAKMRQQRLRRFKSAWMSQNGISEGVEVESWDTNSITPGTEFMNQLAKRLGKMCEQKSTKTTKWVLSSSNEPGEGEHKIMEQWRTDKYMGSHAIYGLDADLIVLSLLNKKKAEPVWLFREQIEMGEVVRDLDGEEAYSWFSIDKLAEHLSGQIGTHSIEEYCFIMSVLGNDFLPSSLSYKMRDDGHDAILEYLQTSNVNLIDEKLEILKEGLFDLFSWLAKSEEERIQKHVFRKNAMSRNYTGLALGDNNWPLDQNVEKILIDTTRKSLVQNWKDSYHKEWLQTVNIDIICKEYIYGLNWIWSYYKGNMNDICFNWFYPWNLPPLWSWLQYKHLDIEFPGIIRVRREDIKPTEQLCLVLPLESWYLLGKNNERLFFERAPWFFPKSFGFGSIGKRYFWECEAEIPIPSISEVKAILE